MTNREWLNTLTDEEFADWLVNQNMPQDEHDKLHTILSRYNSSYLGVISWLAENSEVEV